jgi:AraC-like DNA-binding protein
MSQSVTLETVVRASGFVEHLLDRVPNVVFFVKDVESRYLVVNSTLVVRCGVASKTDLLGRTAAEVFPPPLGTRYLEQDRDVCATGTPMSHKLELHLYPNRQEGWCVTDKIPLVDVDGSVCGLAGISRDVISRDELDDDLGGLAQAVERIRSEYLDPPSVDRLAAEVGMSAYQLNRRMRRLLGITTRQLLVKSRIDVASRLLRTSDLAIGDVAQQSGYFDQSAFTRQFRRSTGLTPREYRARHREGS